MFHLKKNRAQGVIFLVQLICSPLLEQPLRYTQPSPYLVQHCPPLLKVAAHMWNPSCKGFWDMILALLLE